MLLGQVYGELPFMILPLYASLEKLDRSLLEAAADLRRAARASVLGVVAAPDAARASWPAASSSSFRPSAPSSRRTCSAARAPSYVGNLIQSQFAVARDMPFGAALSFVLSLAVVVLLLVFRRPLRAAQASC